ncbi:FecCD family ABC transporter permease [Pseudonocardia kunmingensis]|uniref:Iron complex transport system permease protein n=1 Tax=Pseudonocardia kunmingensis TaxID=630975 RepID=A0A543D4V0_9PSEU|nr:iron ABC transporter permease [Pseudonocardia kunmingensis]TQM04354.1 iron complex transport system permease protein [Pseudonocardia kunmingensis]
MTATLAAPAASRAAPRRRAAVAVTALGLAVVAVCGAAALSLLVGNQPLTPAQVLAGLTGTAGGDADLIVRHVRLPRTLAGLLAGAALGTAGAVLQGLTRNPLAGPGVLGVNAGASLAAVAALALTGLGSLGGYVWFCFAGAALAMAAVFAIGSAGRGGATPVTLALAGAAVSALLHSLTSAIVLLDHDLFARYRFWLVGSLTRADLAMLGQALPFVVAGTLLALALARPLDALTLGDDTARTLGTRLGLVRGLGLAAVVVLAGTATAVAGPIGFVGLVVPHVARLVAGSGHARVLPLAALLGALVLLLADVAGRVLLRPEEVQVGVTAAVLGAPVFLYLVRRRRVAQL